MNMNFQRTLDLLPEDSYDCGDWGSTEADEHIFLVVGYKGTTSRIIAAYESEQDAFNHSADLNELARDNYQYHVESAPLLESY